MKKMHNISVQLEQTGDVLLRQELHDLNEPDPEIRISPEQSALVASWIFQAGVSATAEPAVDEQKVPVDFFKVGDDSYRSDVQVYCNDRGMIVLSIDTAGAQGEGDFLVISPAMAKRLRDQLSRAIRSAFTDMLRPDEES